MEVIKKIILISFVLIISVSVVIRLIGIDAISLWHDEAFSVLLSRMSFGELTYRTGLDVHPPFYYYVLKIWSWIFGQSLFAFRAMSAFFSLLVLVFSYLLIKQIFREKALGVVSVLALALAPFQIQYAQEMRMYSLGAFLIIASSYFLIKVFKKFSWCGFSIYTLLIIMALYTHYYLIFSIFAQALIVLIWRKKRILLSYVIAGLSFLPWLKIFIAQTKQVTEAYWITPPTAMSIPNTLLRLILGSDVSIEQHLIWYSLLILLSLFFIVWGVIKTKNKFKWLIVSLFLIPMILALLLSIKKAIFLDRYFIFTQAFYYILIFMGVFELSNVFDKEIIQYSIRYTLVGFFIILNIFGFISYKQSLDLVNRPGMSAAANYLNKNVKQGDQIFVGSSFVFFNFKYYNQTGIKPLLYAPGEMSHFSGTAILYEDDVIKEFPKTPKAGTSIWTLNTSGFGNFQPKVPETWQLQSEKSWQEVFGHQGWIIVRQYQ